MIEQTQASQTRKGADKVVSVKTKIAQNIRNPHVICICIDIQFVAMKLKLSVQPAGGWLGKNSTLTSQWPLHRREGAQGICSTVKYVCKILFDVCVIMNRTDLVCVDTTRGITIRKASALEWMNGLRLI